MGSSGGSSRLHPAQLADARGTGDVARWSRIPCRWAIQWTLGYADNPQRLATFWALALDYVKEPGFDERDNASIVDGDGVGPAGNDERATP